MSERKAEFGLLMVAFMWAFGFLATDHSIKFITVMQMQVFRFLIAAVALFIIFHKTLLQINKKTVVKGLILGVVFFAAITFLNKGLETTTISKNAFITITQVLFVPLILRIAFKVKISKDLVYGLMIMIIGFFILIFKVDLFNISHSLVSLKEQSHFVIGDLYTLISGFLFALQIVLSGFFVKRENPINLSTIQLFSAGIFSLIACFILKENILSIEISDLKSALPSLVLLGLSGAFAYAGQIVFQKDVGASKVSIFLSVESLFATILSIIAGVEIFSSALIIGGIIITLGIIIAETGFGFLSKKKVPESANNVTLNNIES